MNSVFILSCHGTIKERNCLNVIQFSPYQESVAGSLIQATGTVEFEDDLWIGNHLKAQNGLQRVHIIPGV